MEAVAPPPQHTCPPPSILLSLFSSMLTLFLWKLKLRSTDHSSVFPLPVETSQSISSLPIQLFHSLLLPNVKHVSLQPVLPFVSYIIEWHTPGCYLLKKNQMLIFFFWFCFPMVIRSLPVNKQWMAVNGRMILRLSPSLELWMIHLLLNLLHKCQ